TRAKDATVKIDFPYSGYEQIPPVDVPDTNLMGVYSPRSFDHIDEEKVLSGGFSRPVGAPRLRDAVKGAKSILLLIDDGTRMTPVPRILPHLFEELHAAGLRD